MIDHKSDFQISITNERTGASHGNSDRQSRNRRTQLAVHNWRVERLTGLGVPPVLAEAYADRLDWHQVARLVQRGCPPELALRIVH